MIHVVAFYHFLNSAEPSCVFSCSILPASICPPLLVSHDYLHFWPVNHGLHCNIVWIDVYCYHYVPISFNWQMWKLASFLSVDGVHSVHRFGVPLMYFGPWVDWWAFLCWFSLFFCLFGRSNILMLPFHVPFLGLVWFGEVFVYWVDAETRICDIVSGSGGLHPSYFFGNPATACM